MKKYEGGFLLIGLVIVIAIVVIMAGLYFSSGTTENQIAVEQNAEASTIASTLYHAAQLYVSTQQSMGTAFEANASVPTAALTAGLDTSNIKTLEVRMDDTGTNIKYAYVETNDGTKADYPAGASGKAN